MNSGKRLRIGENKEYRMEMKTNEEIVEEVTGSRSYLSYPMQRVIQLARIGTVPENECVRLPKAEDRPEWATAATLILHQGKDPYCRESKSMYQAVGTIALTRPTPAWTPKVGEAVFYLDTDLIRRVESVDGERFFVSGLPHSAKLKELKPARSFDQMHKPWEGIPNA